MWSVEERKNQHSGWRRIAASQGEAEARASHEARVRELVRLGRAAELRLLHGRDVVVEAPIGAGVVELNGTLF